MSTSPPPSGAQIELRAGDHTATIVEVGAGLRRFAVGEVDVVEPYAEDRIADGARGAILAPWPNRVGDGRYTFGGIDHQLDLSEPGRHNAIHGLVRWLPWRVAGRSDAAVTMTLRLHPTPGYPFCLDLEADYRLRADGLEVHVRVTNRSDVACPYGLGHHPYLAAGPGGVDACTVQVAATSRLVCDDERLLPTGLVPAGGGAYDLTTPRRLDDRVLDTAFTGLARDGDGRAHVSFERSDGHLVDLWMDEGHRWVQLFTGDTLAPARRRTALAVEPMTCPPDAFRTGTDLVRLAPGAAHDASWGIRFGAS